jgi:hypothetical protein
LKKSRGLLLLCFKRIIVAGEFYILQNKKNWFPILGRNQKIEVLPNGLDIIFR